MTDIALQLSGHVKVNSTAGDAPESDSDSSNEASSDTDDAVPAKRSAPTKRRSSKKKRKVTGHFTPAGGADTWVDAAPLRKKAPGGRPKNNLISLLYHWSIDTANPSGKVFNRCIGYSKGCRHRLAAPLHLNHALRHSSMCHLIDPALRQRVSQHLANLSLSARLEIINSASDSSEPTMSSSSVSDPTTSSSSLAVSTPPKPSSIESLVQNGGKSKLKLIVDRDLIYWVCTSAEAFRAVDNVHFRSMVHHLNSKYACPSRSQVEDTLLPQEAAFVQEQAQKYLCTRQHLTLSWDAGMLGNGKLNVHCTVTTENGWRFLFEGKDGSAFSHTGEWYFAFLKDVSDEYVLCIYDVDPVCYRYLLL
jgi:hypothetical protein